MIPVILKLALISGAISTKIVAVTIELVLNKLPNFKLPCICSANLEVKAYTFQILKLWIYLTVRYRVISIYFEIDFGFEWVTWVGHYLRLNQVGERGFCWSK